MALALGAGLAWPLSSAVPSPAKPPLLRNYNVNTENIPSPTHGIIHAIRRDKRGYLWFGTSHGLHKFDGYTVRNFSFGTPQDVGPFVTNIIEDGDSALLLSTWNGLWRFDLATE